MRAHHAPHDDRRARGDPVTPAVADFAPRSREYLLDPQAAVQHLYDETPVFYYEPENAWFVLRYDDVRRVMDDYETYSNECYKTMPVPPHLRERIPAAWEHAGQTIQGRQLNNMDPPAHTVERRAEQRTFTHRRVKAVEPDIAAIANELIDELEGRGGCDLMQEYSVQLTLRVIGRMLDLPREMLPGFLDFIGDVVGLLAPIDMTADRVTMADDQLVGRYERVHAAFVLYSEFLDERRANPGDDLTSAMLALTDDDGQLLLTSDQVLGHMLGLVAAGGDTTALLITNMVRSFTESPDQLRLVLDEPQLWENAVWEGLRRSGIVTQMLRRSREDAEIAGVTIPAGSTVAPSLVSANSDPAKFPEPLRFDVTRANAGDSLTFGHGRHYCLGAPLAIPEARIGLETLYARLPTLQADLDHELEFKPSLNMRMYGSQRVSW